MKKIRVRSNLCASASVLAIVCILSSCPNPLSPGMVTQVKDRISPQITIVSPAEGSCCANIVEVIGRTVDEATLGHGDGSVRALSYTVAGSGIDGEVALASDGTFAFQFSTVTLGTNFTLEITATDWNGNTSVVHLPLCRQAENGIPSFTATPGSKSVTLRWDPVPHTASYILYYTTNGSLPSPTIGITVPSVTSPCVIPGLSNGSLHVFRLKAVPEGSWPESLSDYVRAIPLSPMTLIPQVTGETGQIQVAWNPIPGTNEFEVWRSEEQYGTYDNLTGPLSGNSYVDADVVEDRWYWYKVAPTLAGSAMSFSRGGITDPFCFHHPRLLGVSPCTGAKDVAISGSFAYIADDQSGLRIVDISNPASPSFKGLYPTQASGVAISGSYAFAANVGVGLLVIDVSDASSPSLSATCSIFGVKDVAVSGTYAYAASDVSGLYLIDISEPTSPTIEPNHYATTARAVAVNGSYAYVANPNVGVQIIDISDPESPTLVGTYDALGTEGVAVNGDGTYAYAVDASGLLVIDVRNHAFPNWVATYPVEYPRSVVVADPYAYVITSYGIHVVLVSDSTPIRVAYYDAFDASSVAIDGNCIFVTDWSGLRVSDASAPSLFSTIGTCVTAEASGVAVSGSHAYVADRSGGIRVIDASNQSSPIPVSTCATTDARAVALAGPYAFVADGPAGLRVIDVTNASAPTLLSTCPTTDARAVAVDGDYACIADGTEGLLIIDVSDPASPHLVSTYRTSEASGLSVQDQRAYVAAGGEGLIVIDISDPLLPTLAGKCTSSSYADHVAISGPHAYLASGSEGLHVIDISDPYSPQLQNSWSPGIGEDPIHGVAVSGSYAYVTFDSGLYVLDVSDPGKPGLVRTCPTVQAVDIAVSGSTAYVADRNTGLQVIDLLP